MVRRDVIVRAGAIGLAIIVPITVLAAILDHAIAHFSDSAWAPLFAFAVFGAYAAAGYLAVRLGGDEAPLTYGALAALGAFAGWIPIRVLVWAVREPGHGLVAGHQPVFTPGGLLGQLVFATAFGMMGAVIAVRRMARPRVAPDK